MKSEDSTHEQQALTGTDSAGPDPHAYLKDVLQRLPAHKARLVSELLPHRWQPHHQNMTEVRG